jgi:hypothetical protein
MKTLVFAFLLTFIASAQGASAHSKVILDMTGTGAKTFMNLPVSDNWNIKWSYICSGYEVHRAFAIHIDGPATAYAESGVHESQTKGSGIDYLHGGQGIRNLRLTSTCDWTVSVITE